MRSFENIYDDIIDYPHHVSHTRPQMSMTDRAAQFSPFSALTGYDDAVKETARITERRIELDEYERAVLDERLKILQAQGEQSKEVRIVYFQQDSSKEGGAYDTIVGRVKKIDTFERCIVMSDLKKIRIEDILDLELNLS